MEVVKGTHERVVAQSRLESRGNRTSGKLRTAIIPHMALSDALAYAFFILLALSLPVLLIAAFLPREQRKKFLHWLGRKWLI